MEFLYFSEQLKIWFCKYQKQKRYLEQSQASMTEFFVTELTN